MIFAQKILISRILGQLPALKLRVSGLDPNTNCHHGGHHSTGSTVLNTNCLCAYVSYFTALA